MPLLTPLRRIGTPGGLPGFLPGYLVVRTGTPIVVNRYVDFASAPGGDGTTNATSGAARAYHSLNEALAATQGTNWAALGQRPVINCGGSTADTVQAAFSGTWNTKLSPLCYLEIICNQPTAL